MKHPRLASFSTSIFFLLAIGYLPVSGQTPASNVAQEELQKRIRLLEIQLETLRDEMTILRQALPGCTTTTNAITLEALPALASVSPGGGETNAPEQNKEAAPPEPQSVPAKRQPAGIDLGAVRAVPYGTIYFHAFGNSGGTNNSDVPTFATPAGSGNTGATVRQTRLGLRLEGPKVFDARLTAAIEADFFGGFPAIGIGENFGIMRSRLAYARLDWERTALVAGQDWMVFAPVNPVSIASAGIPQMATAGNLWSRLPQIRLEEKWYEGRLTWHGAVLAPTTGDFPAGINNPAVLQPSTGAASRLPFFQSRIAINDQNWLGLNQPGSVGLSAQYGRARVANTSGNNKIDVVGVALDWSMPILPRTTLSGEAFFGRNLAGFQGGVFQGFNPDFAYLDGARLIAGGPRAIGTRGGWAQLGVTLPTLNDRLTAYASFGLDDPRDEDLISTITRDSRLRNQAFAVNFLYKLSPQLTWGLEYRRFATHYLQSSRQRANHLNLGAALNF